MTPSPSKLHAVFTLTASMLAVVAAALLATRVAEAQRDFRVYPSFEGEDAEAPIPPDWNVPGELVVGRLMYPSSPRSPFGFFNRGDWRQGGTGWTDDYPRGDRTMIQMLRRLSRTSVRSVEQPVNLDDGDQQYFPLLIVGLAFSWELTDSQAAALRDYLLHGGFIFCDSFFGNGNWVAFEESLKRVFPDRPIIDITDDHPVFHNVYDLPHMTSVQIPNMDDLLRGGGGYFVADGKIPRWRGVEDDKGRLMVLIAYNNDVADAWQWADDARYPADAANIALRLGVNMVVYAMTH
jgi:hypothetical protein